MRILAVDPGPTSGVAWTDNREAYVERVALWRADMKARAFGLDRRLEEIAPGWIVCAKLGGYPTLGGTNADAVADAIRAWARSRSVPFETVPLYGVRRHAAGFGDATAPHLVDAARWKLGYRGSEPKEASALWLLDAHLKGIAL